MMRPFLQAACVLGLCACAYIAGIISTIEKTYFYYKVNEVYLYDEAVKIQKSIGKNILKEMFYRTRRDASGMTLHVEDEAYQGYTLYADATPTAYLLDMQGKVVHRWHLPMDAAFENNRLPDQSDYVFWHAVKPYPNGDLLAVYERSQRTPYGSALVKVDKNSRILWRYMGNTHHDVDIAPDGNIYTLAHFIETTPLKGMKTGGSPFFHDYVVKLNANGKQIQKLSILKALANSQYASLLERLPLKRGDVLHSNSVTYITTDMARHFPQAKEGEIMVSLRNIKSIVFINMEQEKVTRLFTGWNTDQHSPSILANGNILMLNNHRPRQWNMSRIIEFNPNTQRVEWLYIGTQEYPFYTNLRGNVQKLPNSNLLITESQGGRLLEITASGKKVWEYYTPLRGGKRKKLISMVNAGQRFNANDLPFLKEKIPHK